MRDMLQLFYDSSDVCCAAAIAALEEADVDWEPKRIDRDDATEAAALRQMASPSGELPAAVISHECRFIGILDVVNFAAPCSAEESAVFRRWEKWARAAQDSMLEPLRRASIASPLQAWIKDEPRLLCLPQCSPPFPSASKSLDDEDVQGDDDIDVSALACQVWKLVDEIDSAVSLPEPPPRRAALFVVPVIALAALYAERFLFGNEPGHSRFTSTTKPWQSTLSEQGYVKVASWAAQYTVDALDRAVADLVLAHTVPIDAPPVFDDRGMAHAIVQGVVYPPFVRPDVVTHLQARFKAESGDIFIATFPKCGTTLMQQIVLLLLHQGLADRVLPHPGLQTQAPWLEACYLRTRRFGGPCPYVDSALLAKAVDHHAGRRVFKTHAPRQLLPKIADDTQIIYVARNPKDCCNSFFAHLTALPPYQYTGDFDHFVRLFLDGKCEHGSWANHHREWWLAAQIDKRILFVFFENIIAHPRDEIARIATFLRVPFSDSVLENVLEASSFDSMRRAAADSSMPQAKSRFRSGKAGKWHIAHGGRITDAHSAAIDSAFLRSMPPQFIQAAPPPYYDVGRHVPVSRCPALLHSS